MNQLSLDLQPEPEYRIKSSLRGTSWVARINRWSSVITINGKRIRLGHFTTAEDAHQAYRAAGGAARIDSEEALARKARQLEIEIGPSVRVIPLTRGQVTVVDAGDHEYLSQWNWYAKWAPSTQSYYAMRATKKVNGKQDIIQMHRDLMKATKGTLVDHIDHDTLNNRRSVNLRLATYVQNGYNRRTGINNSTGYRGVTWSKAMQKWKATIAIDRQVKNLGYFFTAEEASEAYEAIARAEHGEFYRSMSPAPSQSS